MAVSSLFCCAEIEEACSQIELHATSGFAAVRPHKPSVLFQQIHSSTTPEKKPKTHLDDVEEEQFAGLLSPPRSRRPLPGFRARCTYQTAGSPAKPTSAVIGARSMHRVEEVCGLSENRREDYPRRKTETCEVGCQTLAAKPPEVTVTGNVHRIEEVSDLAKKHGVDDQRRKAETREVNSQIAAAKPSDVTGTGSVRRVEEVCDLAEKRRVDEPCRKAVACGVDSSSSVENAANELIQDPTHVDHSNCLEKARCDDLGADMAADVLVSGCQAARMQPCGESHDHELEAPDICEDAGRVAAWAVHGIAQNHELQAPDVVDDAVGRLGALNMDGIADADGEARRGRCSSGLSSNSTLEEWYIGDASANAANAQDAASDGRS